MPDNVFRAAAKVRAVVVQLEAMCEELEDEIIQLRNTAVTFRVALNEAEEDYVGKQ